MAEIRGNVTDKNGNPLDGVKVYLINDTGGTLVGSSTTDSNGDYSFTNLSSSDQYHVLAQYTDADGNLYNAESYPYVGAQDSAYFDVVITATNSPVEETETLTVDYEVENIGTADGTQDITLEIDGNTVDTDSGVSVTQGSTATGTLEWQTESGDQGTYTAKVSSDDDSDTESVNVGDTTAFFDVTINSTNSPVDEGQFLDVDTTIENTGLDEGTQDVKLLIDGTVEDRWSNLYLDKGRSVNTTFSWDTESGDAGTYTATVESDDDSDSTGVEVQTPGGSKAAVASSDDVVYIVELDNYTQIDTVGSGVFTAGLTSVTTNSDYIIAGSNNGELGVWDWDGNLIASDTSSYSNAIYDIEFNPDNTKFVFSVFQDAYKIWDVGGWSETDSFNPGHAYQRQVAWNHGGNNIAVGSGGGYVDVVSSDDTSNVVESWTVSDRVYALEFSKDGAYIATGVLGEKTEVKQTSDYTNVASIGGGGQAAKFNPDTTRLGIAAGEAEIYNVGGDWSLEQTLTELSSVDGVSYGPSGDSFASCSGSSATVYFYDTSDWSVAGSETLNSEGGSGHNDISIQQD